VGVEGGREGGEFGDRVVRGCVRGRGEFRPFITNKFKYFNQLVSNKLFSLSHHLFLLSCIHTFIN